MSNIREGRGGGNIRSYLWPKAPFPMPSPRVPPPPHVHNWQCPSASPSSLPQSSGRGNPTSQLWSPRLHPWVPHSHPGDVPPTLTPPGPTPHSAFTTRCHPTHNGILNPNPPSPRPCNPPLSCSHRGGGGTGRFQACNKLKSGFPRNACEPRQPVSYFPLHGVHAKPRARIHHVFQHHQ